MNDPAITFTEKEVIALALALGYPLDPEELQFIMMGQMGWHIESIRAWMGEGAR